MMRFLLSPLKPSRWRTPRLFHSREDAQEFASDVWGLSYGEYVITEDAY